MSIVISNSIDETIDRGRKIANELKAGDILALYGKIGAGKTHFIKGVALGFNYKANVTSPTFNIVHEYQTQNVNLYHFDFYRLENSRELQNIGFHEYLYGEGICLLEWAEKVSDFLPAKIWHVNIKHLSENQREIDVQFK